MIFDRVVSEDIALGLVRQALSADIIACDTETSGTDIRDGRGYCLGVSLAWRTGTEITALYLPFRHKMLGVGFNYNFDRFRPVLQELLDTGLLCYHNSKFDLVSLATLGLQTLKPEQRFVDTMLLAHLLDENRPSYSLDALARYYLKDTGKDRTIDFKPMKKAFGVGFWELLSPDLICKYAATDAELTLRLFEYLQPFLTAEGLGQIWPHKKKFVELVIKMESWGIKIDTALCEDMTAVGEIKMQEIRDELGLNPGSQQELAVLLNEELKLPVLYHAKTGQPTLDKTAMQQYQIILETSDNPVARQILAYRGWQKSVSSNYRAYLDKLSPDGRLRCNYKLHGTTTGRLSCSEPNLQQIPKQGDNPWTTQMKACFIPNEGYQLISFDFSQLELRLATAYSQEQTLIKVFQEDRDIFEEMSKELGLSRNDTKTFVYSTQYGGGVNRISNVFRISPARARDIRQNYFDSYPGFKRASDRAASLARTNGRLRIWTGRYRHFLYPEDEAHKAFNSKIQGGAADIVEHVMVRCDEAGYNNDDCRLLLQIHDELVFEIRDSLVEAYISKIKALMEQIDFIPELTSVKFAVQHKIWGEK